MSDALATALEDARSRLTSGIEEAEADLVRARARARELRDALTMARELAGIGTGIGGPTRVDPPRAEPPVRARARLDLTHPTKIVVAPPLPVRRRAALESIRRARPPRRMQASFSPDVELRWDGASPLAGTFRGKKEALALLELVLRAIDLGVDPEPSVRTEDATVRVEARPGVRHAAGVRVLMTASIRFDERDRIDRLIITPEEGDALDRLVEAVLA